MGVAAALAETAGCVLCRCTFQSCHVSRVNLTCVTCAPGQGVCEVDVPVLMSVLYNKVRHVDLCVAALLLSVAQGPSKAQ